MPSELETAMESLIMVFHRYAGKEGRSGTLTRRELRTLMENELSGFLKVKFFCHSLSQILRIGNPDQIEAFSCLFNTFCSLSFPTVSEGSNHHRQNYEGLGCQWGWRSELWGVCVFGCGFVHRLWGLLQDAVKEHTKLEPMSLCWCASNENHKNYFCCKVKVQWVCVTGLWPTNSILWALNMSVLKAKCFYLK